MTTAACTFALALWTLRASLGANLVPGVGTSEAWGHLFVGGQVARWVAGLAPIGVADLAGWPEVVPFWPVAPLLQLAQQPLRALLGAPGALTALTVGLVWSVGLGCAWLARRLGATPLASIVAGLTVQTSPFVVQHLNDLVLEPLALGIAACAVGALHQLVVRPSRRSWVLAALATLAVATTSPYYAVYMALGCAFAVRPRRLRGWVAAGTAGAVAMVIATSPLMVTETGPGGRLGGTARGRGYQLTPGRLVAADGGQAHVDPGRPAGPPPPQSSHVAAPDPQLAPGDAPWKRRARRVPGGAALWLFCLMGLTRRRSRPWAILALVFFWGGAGPGLIGRWLHVRGLPLDGPLIDLLGALPLTREMGNTSRMVGAWCLLAGVAGALSVRGWRTGATLTLAAVLEATLVLPPGGVPATMVPGESDVLRALRGPTIVFPTGDPPTWHPYVAPKEPLYFAAAAGVPVAYDYGRGRVPADLAAQRALSEISGAPLSESALVGPLPSPQLLWATLPFESVLILEDRLEPEGRARLTAWMADHAVLRAKGVNMSAWTVPAH